MQLGGFFRTLLLIKSIRGLHDQINKKQIDERYHQSN